MNAEQMRPTPEGARAQLAISQATSLPSTSDRRTHAVGTAVLGLTVGVFMAAQPVVTGASGIALTGAFLACCAAEAVWVERAARTVPRRARRWSRLGFGASFVLALAVVLPWLNLRAQEEPTTWPVVLLAALVVAAPSLVAAAVIARGRR